MSKILVVDDEADVRNMVKSSLMATGFSVIEAGDGAVALALARSEMPDAIILDLMLPELSGIEVCRLLKCNYATARIPIVMLTAKAGEIDRIVGLEVGAEDYVTKPFSPRELTLRVKAILRRADNDLTESESRAVFGDIVIDRLRHRAVVKGRKIDLTATEFKLLAILVEAGGRVQQREHLLNEVWTTRGDIETRTVDTHIRRLREKLGSEADRIETVRGFGYRIAPRKLGQDQP